MVAGDVAFFDESTGLFTRVNAASGQMQWTFDATAIPGAGGATAEPIAYVAGGREFVLNRFGGNSDFATVTAFNPKLKMIRTKTLMQGADSCDHRYIVVTG